MKLVKYIKKCKIAAIIITILITLLIILSSKYISLRSYVKETISIETWNFATNNYSIIELLTHEVDEDKINKLYYEMYKEYNEICRAYRKSGVSGKKGTFDNRLARVHEDYNKEDILKVHKMIDEVLTKHKVSYRDLEKYMRSNYLHTEYLLYKEWEEIITELDSLRF